MACGRRRTTGKTPSVHLGVLFVALDVPTAFVNNQCISHIEIVLVNRFIAQSAVHSDSPPLR